MNKKTVSKKVKAFAKSNHILSSNHTAFDQAKHGPVLLNYKTLKKKFVLMTDHAYIGMQEHINELQDSVKSLLDTLGSGGTKMLDTLQDPTKNLTEKLKQEEKIIQDVIKKVRNK